MRNQIIGTACNCCKPVAIEPEIQYFGVYLNNRCVNVSPTEKAALKHAQDLIDARVSNKSDDSVATDFKISVEKVEILKKH